MVIGGFTTFSNLYYNFHTMRYPIDIFSVIRNNFQTSVIQREFTNSVLFVVPAQHDTIDTAAKSPALSNIVKRRQIFIYDITPRIKSTGRETTGTLCHVA